MTAPHPRLPIAMLAVLGYYGFNNTCGVWDVADGKSASWFKTDLRTNQKTNCEVRAARNSYTDNALNRGVMEGLKPPL